MWEGGASTGNAYIEIRVQENRCTREVYRGQERKSAYTMSTSQRKGENKSTVYSSGMQRADV